MSNSAVNVANKFKLFLNVIFTQVLVSHTLYQGNFDSQLLWSCENVLVDWDINSVLNVSVYVLLAVQSWTK